MDFSVIVLLLAILYIVPEILRRRRAPQEYKYPDIDVPPAPSPAEEQEAQTPSYQAPQTVIPAAAPSFHSIGAPLSEVSLPVEITSLAPEASTTWSALDRNAVVNGIIFAEILKPPRSLTGRNHRRV